MPKTRVQKEETVKVIAEKLGRAKSVVFADYQGLTMSQLSELRSQLIDMGAEFSVTKNNLLKIALKNSNLTMDNDQFLKGSVATLFAYQDEITPIKALVKTLKDAGIGSVKAGLFDGEFMDQYQIVKLSALPSKDELRAKVVGSLGAPLYGIVGVLQANIRNLVYVLSQISDKRQASASTEVQS